MISTWLADTVLIVSLIVSLATYVIVSKREGSYFNILTPAFIVSIPAYYLLPLFFYHVFGNDASPYAYIYVYTTLAVQNVAFAYAYLRPSKKLIRLPFRYSYNGFDRIAFIFLGLAALMYAPVLIQFPEYLLDPRQIYIHTRTGFGINYYISSTCAYLAVILIQFSKRSRWVKGSVLLIAAAVLSLHGAKVQVLSFVLLVALYEVYVRGRKVTFFPAMLWGLGLGLFLLLLFAATMPLGEGPIEALEAISQYSDYTRNAIMLIDSHFPLQYGRLTMEGQVVGRIPRVLWPDKPKNFGAAYLDDQFYPDSVDADAGPPDFGIGVQYADFGALAIVYLVLFALLRGWLTRVFVNRLHYLRHPADFVMLAFLAEISLFPIGGVGWLLPEALMVTLFFRFASCLGADKVYREIRVERTHLSVPAIRPSPDTMGNV